MYGIGIFAHIHLREINFLNAQKLCSHSTCIRFHVTTKQLAPTLLLFFTQKGQLT